MQWPVYSLAEAGAEIIRAYYNGVPDPFATSDSSGGGNNTSNNNNNSTNTHSGGAMSFSAPPLFTSAVALLFATLAVLL